MKERLPARPIRGKATRPAVTERTVEQRARELALIAGRNPNAVTASDRREARRELSGPIHPTRHTADEPRTMARPWDPTTTSSGRRTRRMLPTDDQTTKQTVEEGVDEAEHDQMVNERKRIVTGEE